MKTEKTRTTTGKSMLPQQREALRQAGLCDFSLNKAMLWYYAPPTKNMELQVTEIKRVSFVSFSLRCKENDAGCRSGNRRSRLKKG
ncbi:MAG: hypothetical protein KAT62_06380 [Desulfuromonadales bacterium]|nr:hypothetical protein [Desulfuromonadales bacterium]